MKTGKIQILDLDFEYKLWKNRLVFYAREIEYLFDRIKVIKREEPSFSFGKEKTKRLRAHQKSILHIRNRIVTLEHEIAFYAGDYPIDQNHQHYVNHEIIRDGVMKVVARHEEIMREVYPELCFPIMVNEPDTLEA